MTPDDLTADKWQTWAYVAELSAHIESYAVKLKGHSFILKIDNDPSEIYISF